MDRLLKGKIASVIRVVTFLLLLIWPFVIWQGVAQGALGWLLLLLGITFLLRLYVLKGRLGALAGLGKLLALFGIVLCLASALLRDYHLLLYYPVVMNAMLLLLFGSSLRYGPPVVERLARLQDPSLPPEAVKYTRTVTKVWCVFFICNGAVSLATCLYGNLDIWTMYNGVISYLMIGLVMGIEWLVRQRVKKQQ